MKQFKAVPLRHHSNGLFTKSSLPNTQSIMSHYLCKKSECQDKLVLCALCSLLHLSKMYRHDRCAQRMKGLTFLWLL